MTASLIATSPALLATSPARISTGAAGLDAVLEGGIAPNRLYLVEGAPGAGKTTLALQFLLDGRERGKRGLYVTLSETAEELAAVAASHGWTLDGVDLFELAKCPSGNMLSVCKRFVIRGNVAGFSDSLLYRRAKIVT